MRLKIAVSVVRSRPWAPFHFPELTRSAPKQVAGIRYQRRIFGAVPRRRSRKYHTPATERGYFDTHHHTPVANAAEIAVNTSTAGMQPITNSRVAGSVFLNILLRSSVPVVSISKVKSRKHQGR
jgi:hypothetical protein